MRKAKSKAWGVRTHPDPDANRYDAIFTMWLHDRMTAITSQNVTPREIMALGVSMYEVGYRYDMKNNVVIEVGETDATIEARKGSVTRRFDTIEDLLRELYNMVSNGVSVSGEKPTKKTIRSKISDALAKTFDTFGGDGDID